jgi:hypothetical protein
MPKLSMTRRNFATGAAVTAAVALISPADVLAQSSAQSGAQRQTPQPPKADTPLAKKAEAALAKLGKQSRAEVEMKVSDIFRKYGDRLNEEQKTDILRIMAEGQPPLDTMRAYLLQNGDQPATVLQLYREAKTEARGKK